MAVGFVVTYLAVHFNIVVDSATSDSVIIALTAGLSALYYTVVRFLENHVSGRFGWLLGFAASPIYPAAK